MRSYSILILTVGLPLPACDDPTGSPEPPSTGTLVVAITTEGEDPDPDGNPRRDITVGDGVLKTVSFPVECS